MMKLVDILARDLWDWEWPDNIKALSQDSDGFVGGVADDELEDLSFCQGEWSSSGDGYLEKHELSDDYWTSIVTREQWQAAVDALRASRSPSLYAQIVGRSHRLPEIGSHAHVHDPDGELFYGAGESGEVIAHVENTAVIRMSYGLGCFTAKHLRTAEQIAAEERKKEIGEMIDDTMRESFMITRAQAAIVCAKLHGAGYRKQVTQ